MNYCSLGHKSPGIAQAKRRQAEQGRVLCHSLVTCVTALAIPCVWLEQYESPCISLAFALAVRR